MLYACGPVSDNSYSAQTYRWVMANFNLSKKLHCLALICAILFAHMAPNVFTPAHYIKNTPGIKQLRPTDDTTEHVRNTPWVSKTGTAMGIAYYILPFTVYAIALYERESPLRKYMAANQGSLGSAWTTAHGFKAINGASLVRMGLASSHGIKVWHGPKFGQHVRLLSDELIEHTCDAVENRLTKAKDAYGPFDAAEFLMGAKSARLLSAHIEIRDPPPVGGAHTADENVTRRLLADVVQAPPRNRRRILDE